MDDHNITLRILLPYLVFTERNDVKSIIAETDCGSFGILPHRLDCTASIAPGLLIYKDKADNEVWVAVDSGILVKCRFDVTIAVRSAISDTDPEKLKRAVKNIFLNISEFDKKVRTIMTKLESSFLRSITELKNE